MACKFEITLPEHQSNAVQISRNALDRIDKIESQLTVFRDTSEISYINQNAASHPVRAEHNLFDLLSRCKELSIATEGAFDITSGPLTRCWGFLRRQGRLPEPAEINGALRAVGMQRLLLDERSRTVQFAVSGMEINLGAIGKGFALDCIAPAVRERFCARALLSGGSSSIVAIGCGNPGKGWSVGIRHPVSLDSRLAILRLRDCAMATSGSNEQYFEIAGERYCHIIDPRSGRPAIGLASVTVVATSGADADALSTAFFIGGPDLARRYCESHPDVMAIMLGEQTEHRPLIIGSNSGCEVELIHSDPGGHR